MAPERKAAARKSRPRSHLRQGGGQKSAARKTVAKVAATADAAGTTPARPAAQEGRAGRPVTKTIVVKPVARKTQQPRHPRKTAAPARARPLPGRPRAQGAARRS